MEEKLDTKAFDGTLPWQRTLPNGTGECVDRVRPSGSGDAHTDNGCGLKPGRGWPGFLRSDQLTARAEFLAPAHGRSGPLFRGYGTQDVQTLLPDGRLE